MVSKNPKAKPPDAPLVNPKPGPVRAPPVTNNVTGRVQFDERGNAVWEWAVSTGTFGIDVSTQRLRKLENASLSITADDPPPAPVQPPVATRKATAQDGYSPYDSGLLVKAKDEVQRAKKKDLKRLGEWLKLRATANPKKQSDD